MENTIQLYSFYQLVDPRNQLPFYIGRTLSFDRRKKDYLARHPHSLPLDKHLQELEHLGLQPIMQELEHMECTAVEAAEREAYWINKLTSEGLVLLNKLHNKKQRIKATFYLKASDIVAIRTMQIKRFEQSGKTPEISELVSEAIQLLAKQENI
jgi:hypothetical protein